MDKMPAYNRLYYDDMAEITEDNIKSLLVPAKEFISTIEMLIGNKK